jgi:uncharacterized protein
MKDYFEELLGYAETLEIIDAHEHLIGEAAHVRRYLSFYDFIASYIQWDLYGAGMSKDLVWNYPQNEAEEISHFAGIEPYWRYVRHGSYARPMCLALKQFFGFDDLTEENFLEIGQRLRAANLPGHYDAVFDQAKIKRIINQSPEHPFDDPRFVYGRPIQIFKEEDLREYFQANPAAGLEDLLEQLDESLKADKAKGAVSAKVFIANFVQSPDRAKAVAQVEALKSGSPVDLEPLLTYLYDQTLALCPKYDLIAAVHTGVWTNLNRQTPELAFNLVENHPNTTFDIYHMGLPYAAVCAFLGKNFPNAHLNLCWAHSVSETMTLNALDEWLDLVPTNKIIGFGGDLITLPEHVWGMLQLAKENLARVLTHRIRRERLDLDGAKEILRLWLYENPTRLYKLG